MNGRKSALDLHVAFRASAAKMPNHDPIKFNRIRVELFHS